MKIKLILLLCLYLFISHKTAFSQNKTIVFDRQLYVLEDSLKNLGKKIVNDESEFIRSGANFTFIKTLVSALKLPNSFEFPFDSVRSISILKSDDNKFRIFTWHLRSDSRTYRYYGAIQVNNKEKLELYALFDYSVYIENPEDTVLNKDTWYGAHYYKLITPEKPKKNKKYILLGWKGNNRLTQQKVIEVLSFKDGKPVFGAPVFKMNDNNAKRQRIIFSYNANVAMMLRYLEEKKWIVYDHLVAPPGTPPDMFEMYGPDLSYDGLAYKKGKWVLMEKIDLRNEPSIMDKLYNDPSE
jgi:hypothetical protein